MWQCHYACVLREFFLERLIQNFLKEKEKKKFSFFFLIPPSFPTNSFPEACATEHVTLKEGWSCGNSWPKSRGDSAEKGKGRLLSRLLQSWPERHVNSRTFHFNVWQNSLQIKKINKKKKKKKFYLWDFPGGAVLRLCTASERGMGSIPGQGNNSLHAARHGQKKEKKKRMSQRSWEFYLWSKLN